MKNSRFRSVKALSALAVLCLLTACSSVDFNKFSETQQVDEPFYKRHDEADRLLAQAGALERGDHFDRADYLYREIIDDFPDAVFQDQNRRFSYAALAEKRIELNRCRRLVVLFHYAETTEELHQRVTQAARKRDFRQLQKYAACDFEFRLKESEARWQAGKNIYAMEIIADAHKQLDRIKKISKDRCVMQDEEMRCFNDLYGFGFKKRKWGWVLSSFTAHSRHLLDRIQMMQKLQKVQIERKEPRVLRVPYGTRVSVPQALYERLRLHDQHFRFLEMDDFQATDHWFFEFGRSETVHTVVGDFNGDKKNDAAFILRSGDKLVTRVGLSQEVGYKIHDLNVFEHPMGERVKVGINLAKPDAYGPTWERRPVKNRYDAIIWRRFDGKAWLVWLEKGRFRVKKVID